MAKYGQTSWSDSGDKGKEDLMNLEDGMNCIRVVTDPYRYFYHKIKLPNDPNTFGRNIRCCTTNCPMCKSGITQKTKYVIGAINRKTHEYKKLSIGIQIFNFIKGIKDIPGYEDLKSYDLNIIRNPKGGATNFYQVIPGEKYALSADDIKIVDNIDPEELGKYCMPPSAEEITGTIERITRWIEKTKGGKEVPQKSNEPQQIPVFTLPAADAVPTAAVEEKKEVVSDDIYSFNVAKK